MKGIIGNFTMVELDVRIKAKDLYDFLLVHSYSQLSGLFGSILGAIMIMVGASNKQWIFVIGGGALLLYLPWVLFIKSRQQILGNPSFKESFKYRLDDEGITISQGDISETHEWSTIVKAISTPRSIIVYTSRVNATIFPKSEMRDKKNAVIEIISKNVPPKNVKIRA